MSLRLFKKVILLLILAITLIFAAQNFEAVNIKFLIWSINLPIAVTLLGIYALGGITGGLLFSMIKRVIEMDKKEQYKKINPADDPKSSNREFQQQK